jgi:hypothetical protein
MNARPFLAPFSALRSRMKAVSGKGFEGNAEADEEKVGYHPAGRPVSTPREAAQ